MERAKVMDALLAVDDVVGGSGGGRDGFGAYGGVPGTVAGTVPPFSIGVPHKHAVLALAPVRLIPVPVCERAVAVVH